MKLHRCRCAPEYVGCFTCDKIRDLFREHIFYRKLHKIHLCNTMIFLVDSPSLDHNNDSSTCNIWKWYVSWSRFFMNPVALISSTRKVAWFCNDIGTRSNDTSLPLHPPLAFSPVNCIGLRACLKPRRQSGGAAFLYPVGASTAHGFGLFLLFFFPTNSPSNRARFFFSLARLRSSAPSNRARSHLFRFSARSYGFKCKFRARHTASVDRREFRWARTSRRGRGRGRGDRICVRIARNAQTDGQTKWFAVAWTHSCKCTALQLRDETRRDETWSENHVMTITFNNERSHLPRLPQSDTVSPIIFIRFSFGYGLFECIKVHDISYVQGRGCWISIRVQGYRNHVVFA